jgi:protein TonB
VSYAQRHPIRASRTFAIAIVGLIQASLGYALVTGLAYTVVQKAPDGLKTFNVEEEQQPPPELRPTPKRVRESEPPVVAPPPPFHRMNAAPAAAPQAMLQAVPLQVTPAAVPALPQPQWAPPPAPIETVPPRSATGDLQRLFRPEDYPLSALEHKEQGSVIVRLTINVAGRVGACDVTSSSGSRTLDNASCQILQSRALFTPARDSSGNPTTDTVNQEIRWMLG